MELTLKRIALKEEYTIGKLYVNGVYECDTLEDKVRDLTKEKKVYGKTAIPSGRYEVTLGIQSPRFRTKTAYQFCAGYLPRLLNVPNFDGVLIHIGNKPQDSEGRIPFLRRGISFPTHFLRSETVQANAFPRMQGLPAIDILSSPF